MPFLILLALMTACLPVAWREPAISWGILGSVSATMLATFLVVLSAKSLAGLTVRQLTTYPGELQAVLRRYSTFRIYHGLALLVTYALSMLVLGWGWAIQQWATVSTEEFGPLLLPGVELLILAPFFVMVLASWWYFYNVEATLNHVLNHVGDAESRRTFPSRVRYLLFHTRQFALLLMVPITVLIVRQALARLFPEWMAGTSARTMMLVIVLGIFLLYPFLIAPLLGLKSLPDGPTRERLVARSRWLGMGFREVFLWDTHRTTANAMVIGFVGPARFLVFTDRLLEELSPEEVDAVFGHEAGHVHHAHPLYYAGFLILSLLAFSAGWTILERQLAQHWHPEWHQYADWLIPVPFLLVGLYVFVIFGMLSRRCERQADLFGCRVASATDLNVPIHKQPLTPDGVHTFIHALESVLRVNGMSRLTGPDHSPRRSWIGRFLHQVMSWLNTWQHSTVARRVQFLKQVVDDPTLEQRFQRRLARLRWGILAVLVILVVGLATHSGWGVLVSGM